ncbi:MAG: secretion system protein [Sphingomonadales bacterium BRH_c3]|nr:MAG: secretion system protein [Sphingomonadales bacterium BRH_c3]
MTAEIIRIFILLAIFAAVFVATQFIGSSVEQSRSHRGAVNKRLKLIAAGRDREEIVGQLVKTRPKGLPQLPEVLEGILMSMQRMVFQSGITITLGQLLVFIVIGFVAVFMLTVFGLAIFGYPIAIGTFVLSLIFSLALAVATPLLTVSRMASSRRKRIEHQFPIALDVFVRALRSGHPIASAIDLLTKEMEDPIGTEFGLISDEIAYGVDLIGAISHMAERWDLDDMKMFAVSISVQSETGGNLAEILDNISKVIRDRHQMFMKVRALSSEGRMTAWMLSVLPVFTFVSIFLLTPQYYFETAEDPIFIYGFIGLAVMYVLGVYIIRRLIDLKV